MKKEELVTKVQALVNEIEELVNTNLEFNEGLDTDCKKSMILAELTSIYWDIDDIEDEDLKND